MEEYTIKYASKGISILFNQITQASDHHIEFIDPLCTIIKIGLLKYKGEGTKLSIKNNIITLQDSWALQGLQRWMNNDERDQLHHLKIPVFYFRGLVLGHIIFDHLDVSTDTFNYINDLAIKGLKKMKMTYLHEKKTGSLIKNCIDDYIKTLSTNFTLDDYMIQMHENNKPTLVAIYNEYTKLWHVNDINLIVNLFKMADLREESELQNKLADTIDHFIMFKDKEIDFIRPD
jgi:hypothetical protein